MGSKRPHTVESRRWAPGIAYRRGAVEGPRRRRRAARLETPYFAHISAISATFARSARSPRLAPSVTAEHGAGLHIAGAPRRRHCARNCYGMPSRRRRPLRQVRDHALSSRRGVLGLGRERATSVVTTRCIDAARLAPESPLLAGQRRDRASRLRAALWRRSPRRRRYGRDPRLRRLAASSSAVARHRPADHWERGARPARVALAALRSRAARGRAPHAQKFDDSRSVPMSVLRTATECAGAQRRPCRATLTRRTRLLGEPRSLLSHLQLAKGAAYASGGRHGLALHAAPSALVDRDSNSARHARANRRVAAVLADRLSRPRPADWRRLTNAAEH